jgi:hypothetical protein
VEKTANSVRNDTPILFHFSFHSSFFTSPVLCCCIYYCNWDECESSIIYLGDWKMGINLFNTFGELEYLEVFLINFVLWNYFSNKYNFYLAMS